MELTVECQKREEGSKPKALRRSGLLPAVLYGHNGAESIALTINAKTAEKLLKQAGVKNSLIQLNIPDLSWSGKTLLREVQKHPWKDSLYHLSFFAVAAQDSIEVEVPLNFTGNSPGVKQDGGILGTEITQLAVRCAPNKIPENIDVDISALRIGGALHVGELTLPDGVIALGNKEQVVVQVLAPQSREVSETASETTAEPE